MPAVIRIGVLLASLSLWLLQWSSPSVAAFQSPPFLNRRVYSTKFSADTCLAAKPEFATVIDKGQTKTAGRKTQSKSFPRKKTGSGGRYSLLPLHVREQSIQTTQWNERKCLERNVSWDDPAATRQWISQFLKILTQWARVGNGQEAERFLLQGLQKLPTSDQKQRLDVEIKGRRRVLHAWCNQVSRRFKARNQVELGQYATGADRVLQNMQALNKEYQSLSADNNKSSTNLLTANDYVAVIQASTKCGRVESAVRSLQSMEKAFVASQYDSNLAPTIHLYTSVIKSLANCQYKPAEWRSKMELTKLPAQVATELAQRCRELSKACNGLKPDLVLYNAVLDAWSKELPPPSQKPTASEDSTKLDKVAHGARAAWNEMVAQGMEPDAQSYSLMIFTLCKCGLLDEAYSTWQELLDRLLSAKGTFPMEQVDTRSFKIFINCSARRISEMARNTTTLEGNSTIHAERIGEVLDGLWRLHEAGYKRTAPDKYLYTTAITSWAHVPAPESAQRAQDWFMDLEFKFQSTGWESLRPDVAVYNGVVNAFAKQPNKAQAAVKAGSIVKQMERISATNPYVLPDTITYNTLIDACLASEEDSGIERAEQTLLWMLKEYRSGNDRVQPNARSYVAIIREWASSTLPGSTAKAEILLDLMEERFDPAASLYEQVIFAWCHDAQTAAKVPNSTVTDAAQRASRLLFRMEQLYREMDNEAMRPDLSLFTAVMKAWNVFGPDGYEEAENVRQLRDRLYSDDSNEMLLKKMTFQSNAEVFALVKKLEGADATPRTLGKKWNFNVLLKLLAKSGKLWAGQRAEDVLDYMLEAFQRTGADEVQPDVITFNSVMDAWARCSHPEAALKAEAVLDRLSSLHEAGALEEVKPDRVSYNTVINAHAKSAEPGSAQEAERVFEELLHMYESTNDERYKPDIVSYTSLMKAWANSKDPAAPARAESVLLQMLQEHKQDPTRVKPNTMCFNSVIHAWATSSDEGASKKAEMMLRLMEDMYIGGNDDVQPDTQTYNIVLNALANSPDKDAGTKAQLLLERMKEECRNGNKAVKPDIITYNTVINAVANHGKKESLDAIGTLLEEVYDNDELVLSVDFYASLINCLSRSGAKGAVWLAEQILAVLKQMNKNGVIHVKPDTTVYNALITCWSKSGERTSARRAEDILNYMEAEHGRGNLAVKPNVQTYTSVIDVIAKSRIPDVERAEKIFERMQDRWRSGDSSVQPNAHTYTALIHAYARSDLPTKASKAQSVLKRMKVDFANGNHHAQPTVVAYNAVLNACEFTVGDDHVVQEAFKVACLVFDELRSSTALRPNHVTYGSFMGVCGELMPKSDVRNDMLDLVFRRCCADGQVGPVVLKKLGVAASPSLYSRLLGGLDEVDLPLKWTTNVQER